MSEIKYEWTDNPTVSGVSRCDTDILNDCLMHLKYDNQQGDSMPLFYSVYSDTDMTTTVAFVNASLGSWLSGDVYTTAFDELVDKIGTANVKLSADSYTDYDFVVNQDDMIFRLPLFTKDRQLIATGTNDYNGSWALFADGWYEENGVVDIGGTSKVLVDLSRSYDSTNFIANAQNAYTGTGQNHSWFCYPNSTSQIAIYNSNGSSLPFSWKTEGYLTPKVEDYKLCNLYFKLASAVVNEELLDVANVMKAVNTLGVTVVPDNKKLITSYGMPDYSSGVSRSHKIVYQAEYDSILIGTGKTSSGSVCEFLVSYDSETWIKVDGGDGYAGMNGSLTAWVPKGMYFKNDKGSSWTYTQYPLKGAR